MTMLYHQVTRQTVQVTIIYYLTNLKHQKYDLTLMVVLNSILNIADILDNLCFGTR